MIQDILKSCGYPTCTLVLDCESYFDKDFNLSKMSTYEFVSDERFVVLGWAIKSDDQYAVFKQTLPDIDFENVTVIMHNASFDALVLAMYSNIYPPFIIDTLDLARHIEPRRKNSLAELCKRYNLPDKGETKQFMGMHLSDFNRKTRDDLIEYATDDAEREYDLLRILLPKLSNPRFELDVARYTRDLFIGPELHFDVERAASLKINMQAEIQAALNRADTTEKIVRGEESFKALLQEALGDEAPPMKQGKKKPLLAIAKTDPGYSYLLDHPKPRVRQVMEARVAAKSWPKDIKRVEKLQAIFEAAGCKMPIPLKYCGAHTGRWSGGEGINPQNFTARGHPLSNEIRTLIEAPEGYVLFILDFMQIEARGLDWIAGQDDMVQAFAEGRQIYCEFASKLVGHRIRKPRKTDSEAVAKWHGNYRQMGKIGILGAGYGMGVEHCILYAKNNFGVELDYSMGKKIIDLYRRTHSMVVLFWEKVERAFQMATQTKGEYRVCDSLKFSREDNVTIIELPNTRKLRYTGAKVEGTVRYPQLVMPDPRKIGESIRMWGGYLTENIVQALSRDILAETILKIEGTLGLRVPMTVHDDMSVLIPEDKVDFYRPQIEAIARTTPAWAPGLPVDIEGKVSKEYCK